MLSRCQRFDFAPVEIQEIVARLKFIVDSEKAEADEAALELIARRAAGSMRDSQSLLEQVLSFSTGQLTADHVHSMLGTANDERLHQLAHALADRDAAAALKLMDKAVDEGVDAGKLAEQLLGYFRDLMAVTVGCDASMLRHAAASMHSSLSELGNRWGLQTVLAVVGLIDQTLARTRHSVYARVLLEATLIQICNLPDLQRIADLADAAGRYQSSSRTASGGNSEKKKASQPVIGSTPSISELSKPQETRNQPPSENRSETASKKSSEQEPSKKESSHQESTAPSIATPINQVTWTPTNANKVWQIVTSRLESMSESLARMVEKVEATGSNTAKLHLPHNSSLAKRRLEAPEQRDAIMQVLKEITGGNISFEVVLQNPPTNAQQVQQKISKPSRMQRMREIENNQLIKDCLEVFEAEIINVDQQ